jgi:opacity protein-like surface antigen
MKKIIMSVCAAAAMSGVAFAGGDFVKVVEPVVVVPVDVVDDSSFYVGLALSAISSRDSDVSMDFFNAKAGQDRLGNFTFLAGYNFNKYIAVEGRYTTTFTEEDYVEMSGWSLFVKPQYPVTDDFKIYALLGFGGVTMDAVNNANVDVDDTAFQWGLGASYNVWENVEIFADYTSLANGMDGTYWNGALEVDADVITMGVNYKF